MKHKYLSKRYWNDPATPMGNVDELARNYDDVINFSLGDPDRITNEIIINKAFEDAKAGHTKYTDFRGDPELREEICKYYKNRFDMDVDDEEVFVTSSGCIAMYLVLEAILDDGDEVIMQSPYFTPYLRQVKLTRGIPVELPTYEEEDFQINMERLESLISERSKALIINSPSNPTGNCLKMETMEKLLLIAEKYDLIVICDDIYTAFSYEHAFVPFASLPNARERSIIINSFSKDYTMTGWRLGNIIAPDYIIKTIKAINESVAFTAPSISQRGALEALRRRDEIQPPMVEEYRKRIFYTAERINQIPKMHVIYPPKGSIYLFVNIKDTGLTSIEASDALLREAHVLTVPGIAFGECGEGYIRLACTVDMDTIREAFDRIAKAPSFN